MPGVRIYTGRRKNNTVTEKGCRKMLRRYNLHQREIYPEYG